MSTGEVSECSRAGTGRWGRSRGFVLHMTTDLIQDDTKYAHLISKIRLVHVDLSCLKLCCRNRHEPIDRVRFYFKSRRPDVLIKCYFWFPRNVCRITLLNSWIRNGPILQMSIIMQSLLVATVIKNVSTTWRNWYVFSVLWQQLDRWCCFYKFRWCTYILAHDSRPTQ